MHQDAIMSIAKQAIFSVNVTSTAIHVPFRFALPRFIPLPDIHVPFTTLIRVSNDNITVLDIKMGPISISTDDTNFYIASEVSSSLIEDL
jgi:hypothetical protein